MRRTSFAHSHRQRPGTACPALPGRRCALPDARCVRRHGVPSKHWVPRRWRSGAGSTSPAATRTPRGSTRCTASRAGKSSRRWGTSGGGDDSFWLQGALTTFAHEGISNTGWATHMRVLDPGEASAWIAERIGPRGGTRYRPAGARRREDACITPHRPGSGWDRGVGSAVSDSGERANTQTRGMAQAPPVCGRHYPRGREDGPALEESHPSIFRRAVRGLSQRPLARRGQADGQHR